jgi:hypothetical protein
MPDADVKYASDSAFLLGFEALYTRVTGVPGGAVASTARSNWRCSSNRTSVGCGVKPRRPRRWDGPNRPTLRLCAIQRRPSGASSQQPRYPRRDGGSLHIRDGGNSFQTTINAAACCAGTAHTGSGRPEYSSAPARHEADGCTASRAISLHPPVTGF